MDESAEAGPVSVRNRQDRHPLPEALLQRLAQCGADSLRLVRDRYLERVSPPGEIAVFFIDDAEIARVHGEFMDDPTPTDVITFPYGEFGEILVSTETAARQAAEYGVPLARELALYLVHGLLHLCGYDDRNEEARDEMTLLQESLVEESFADD